MAICGLDLSVRQWVFSSLCPHALGWLLPHKVQNDLIILFNGNVCDVEKRPCVFSLHWSECIRPCNKIPSFNPFTTLQKFLFRLSSAQELLQIPFSSLNRRFVELRLRQGRLLRVSRARRARASNQSSRAQGVNPRQWRTVEHVTPSRRRRLRTGRRTGNGKTMV